MAAVSGDDTWESLPDDLWADIFAHLDRHDERCLEPISLVCKRFLAISNGARTTFSVNYNLAPVLFSRFRHIHTVHFAFPFREVESRITQLADSGLSLRAFHLTAYYDFPRDPLCLLGSRMERTLRVLSLVKIFVMTDADIAAVAGSCPRLEELDIQSSGSCASPPISDEGILSVSLKLKSLVSVNLRSQRMLTPQSLHHLSTNCPSIRDLSAELAEHSPVSLVDDILPFASLTSLHLAHAEISESVLSRISTANWKLWKLVLMPSQRSTDITAATLCRFLKSCRSLCHLELGGFTFPPELSAGDFAASIQNIKLIGIDSINPPESTFFHLLRDCPCLENIWLACEGLGSVFGLPVLRRVRKIRLSYCQDLSEETLAVIGSAFPNLESLRFLSCSVITELGMEAIKTKCASIKHLKAWTCHSLEYYSLNTELEKPWWLLY